MLLRSLYEPVAAGPGRRAEAHWCCEGYHGKPLTTLPDQRNQDAQENYEEIGMNQTHTPEDALSSIFADQTEYKIMHIPACRANSCGHDKHLAIITMQ